jgi:DNA-binding MurR/RpiR family transcriptional regulator
MPKQGDNAADLVQQGLLARLGQSRAQLSGALAQVAEAVLADPAGASRATITELAERVGTSPGTITRFCRALGFGGYQELRVALAEEAGRAAQGRWNTDIGREIHQDDKTDRVLEVLLAANIRALEETAAQLDLPAVDAVVRDLVDARQVHLFGIGTSGVSAEELRLRLFRIGVPCWAWSDVHNGLTSATLLDGRDVAVGISESGRVNETHDFLHEARRRGATTVAITGDATSPLAAAADLVLTTAARPTEFRSDALAGRHAQFLVLDVLYARFAQVTADRTMTLLERTAGAVAPHRTAAEPKPRRNAPRP